MWTILVIMNKSPKRCIGVFKTKDEAEAWATMEGYGTPGGIDCKIIRLDP